MPWATDLIIFLDSKPWGRRHFAGCPLTRNANRPFRSGLVRSGRLQESPRAPRPL